MSRNQGVTEEKLTELADFEASWTFSELEKLVLRYAAAMTATPLDVSDQLFAELKKHFNDKELVELTSSIAWENYRARFNHAFGIDAEGFSEDAFCPLPHRVHS